VRIPVSAQDSTPVPGDVPQISLDPLNVRDLEIDMGEGWTADAEFTWPKRRHWPLPDGHSVSRRLLVVAAWTAHTGKTPAIPSRNAISVCWRPS